MTVYLDNAATTSLDKEVIAEMLPIMQEEYGNPSSIHAYGRKHVLELKELVNQSQNI